jgi:hypothetical protein
MTPAELSAATVMYHALTLLPCTCRYQWPYNIDKGALLHHCHRCKALDGWDVVAPKGHAA